MKITYIRITVLAYFLTDTLKLQVVGGQEKYLLNSLCKKLFKTNVNGKKCVSSKDKQIN